MKNLQDFDPSKNHGDSMVVKMAQENPIEIDLNLGSFEPNPTS